MSQVELFSDAEVVDIKATCAECAHILAVEFNSQRLFFCEAQKGGKYGKKIKKGDVACKQYQDATNEEIPRWEGLWGGWLDGVKRGAKGPKATNRLNNPSETGAVQCSDD